LKGFSGAVDGTLLVQMGRCYLHAEDDQEAEICFQGAIQLDEEDVDARVELARMYERLDRPEEAFRHLNQVMLLRRRQDTRTSRKPFEGAEDKAIEESSTSPKESTGCRYRPRERAKARFTQASQAEHLQIQHAILRDESEGMRRGDVISVDAWMNAARDLTDDFRSFKTFFPLDKYIKFLGYSGDSRGEAETSLDLDLTAMAERLSRGLSWPVLYL
jgi:general transcription factor 3C polypeptide 3 (transcription factor C subunit 4)